MRSQILLFFVVFILGISPASLSQGFLKADGQRIINGRGENVLLRGIGLGGWMLQEGYMLHLNKEGQQYRIKERIAALIGEEIEQLRRNRRQGDCSMAVLYRQHMQREDLMAELAARGIPFIVIGLNVLETAMARDVLALLCEAYTPDPSRPSQVFLVMASVAFILMTATLVLTATANVLVQRRFRQQ